MMRLGTAGGPVGSKRPPAARGPARADSVFSDPALGQQLRKLESRWRRGEVADVRAALDRLVAARYGPL
jgi:hypothetical protein